MRIALVGNPNSGKSTLFNRLTGLRQRTGNFPGVTVEKKSGTFCLPDGRDVEITDLPGTYSLYPRSLDERITAEFILNPDLGPHAALVIADASNLKRSLFLISQLQDTRIPMVVALNMIDLAIKNGDKLDLEKLNKEFNAVFVPCNSRSGEGVVDVLHALESLQAVHTGIEPALFASAREEEQREESVRRYSRIGSILREAYVPGKNKMNSITSKADKILTHRIAGFAIFLFILFIIFQSLFYLSAWPMDIIDGWFSSFSAWVKDKTGTGELSSLIAEGIIPGVGGVLMFVPQIAFLFLFITLLEDTGYMSRVSFIMDRLFRKFGMSGRSVIPLMSGMACAIPAILGTRTVSNRKERMITLFVTPMMSCSARLPVFAFMIALVIPDQMLGGFIQLQGLVLMGLYLLGFLGALLTAWVMKWLLKSNERSYFIMELPVYRYPRWTSVGQTIIDKVKIFIKDAGLVIVAISILLWYLAAHGPGNEFQKIEERIRSEVQAGIIPADKAAAAEASEKLRASWAGYIGRGIEPVIAPLGFDWKIGIALITSFAAREVFVGTMATIYSLEDESVSTSTLQKLRSQTNVQGEKVFSLATGCSLMIFYVYAMQCMSTFAVVYRETKSWKWPVIQTVFLSCFAWITSFLTFTLLS
ncbi:MAG: ferrous iron transport protein B [Bacteroidia bacterium]|nr:ferrous iron transport protein B [Bacteroidia bacterium]